MENSNKKWFIAIYVVIAVSALLVWVTMASSKQTLNYTFLKTVFDGYHIQDNIDVKIDTVLYKKAINNPWTSNLDATSCDVWNLEFKEDWSVLCYDTTLLTYVPLTNTSDNIDDDWDNDDYRCQYFDDIEVSKIDLLNSKDCDDDDLYRLELEWMIPPLYKETVLVLDEDTISLIEWNQYNLWTYSKRDLPWNNTFTINLELSWSDAELTINKIDKSSSKIITDTVSWNSIFSNWVIQNNVSLWSWDDMIFDTSKEYYSVLIENTWNSTITYKITATSLSTGQMVYITPIDDSDESMKILFKSYFDSISWWTWIKDYEYIGFNVLYLVPGETPPLSTASI